MKMLFAIAFVAMLAIPSAHAENDKAVSAFWASKEVTEAVAEYQANGYKDMGDVQSVMLSGSCGFAGCSSQVLVAVTMSTRGSNTQTTSVVAIVDIPAIRGQAVAVKLANIQ